MLIEDDGDMVARESKEDEDEEAKEETQLDKKPGENNNVPSTDEESSEDEEAPENVNTVAGKDKVPARRVAKTGVMQGEEASPKNMMVERESSDEEEEKEEGHQVVEGETSGCGRGNTVAEGEPSEYESSDDEKGEAQVVDTKSSDEEAMKQCMEQLKLIEDMEALEKLHKEIYGEQIPGGATLQTGEETKGQLAKEDPEQEEESSEDEEEVETKGATLQTGEETKGQSAKEDSEQEEESSEDEEEVETKGDSQAAKEDGKEEEKKDAESSSEVEAEEVEGGEKKGADDEDGKVFDDEGNKDNDNKKGEAKDSSSSSSASSSSSESDTSGEPQSEDNVVVDKDKPRSDLRRWSKNFRKYHLPKIDPNMPSAHARALARLLKMKQLTIPECLMPYVGSIIPKCVEEELSQKKVEPKEKPDVKAELATPTHRVRSKTSLGSLVQNNMDGYDMY